MVLKPGMPACFRSHCLSNMNILSNLKATGPIAIRLYVIIIIMTKEEAQLDMSNLFKSYIMVQTIIHASGVKNGPTPAVISFHIHCTYNEKKKSSLPRALIFCV